MQKLSNCTELIDARVNLHLTLIRHIFDAALMYNEQFHM